MTLETKEEAERLGRRLLKRMKGEGWTLRVWENVGWHFCVQNGPASVYPTFGGDLYHCLLNDEDVKGDPGAGCTAWTSHTRHTDPNIAFQTELRAARQYANHIHQMLSAIEGRMYPIPFG